MSSRAEREFYAGNHAAHVLRSNQCACVHIFCRLGYADAADVIEMKGRVACEISSGDELLLTELIFNGAFNDLSVEQEVALLSCFVFQEKVRVFKLPPVAGTIITAGQRTNILSNVHFDLPLFCKCPPQSDMHTSSPANLSNLSFQNETWPVTLTVQPSQVIIVPAVESILATIS